DADLHGRRQLRVGSHRPDRPGTAGTAAAGALGALLDRDVHHVPPLRPRAVVVLDVVVAQELVQHEPGVRRALADPAVGDDRVAVRHALAAVQLAELLGVLERAVLLHGLRPGDRRRARDVARALRALLLVARHRDQLAGELGGRPDVDELRRASEVLHHLVALGPDGLVAGLGAERGRLVARGR